MNQPTQPFIDIKFGNFLAPIFNVYVLIKDQPLKN